MIADPSHRRNWYIELPDYIRKMKRLCKLAGLRRDDPGAHPATAHIARLEDYCQRHVTENGLSIGPLPRDTIAVVAKCREVVGAMSFYGLDRMYWLADHYFEELECDVQARRFVETRLPRPELFWSVISELQQWGYLKARGLRPQLNQEDGLPDLSFYGNSSDDAHYFEVKTVEKGTSTNAIKQHIKKANRQIKNVGDDVRGGCFLRLLETFTGGYEDGQLPEKVRTYFEVLEQAMTSEHYKSVGQAVLTWEEISCVGNIPGWQTWCIVRRSASRNHKSARVPIELDGSHHMKATTAGNLLIGNEQLKPNWDLQTKEGRIITTGR